MKSFDNVDIVTPKMRFDEVISTYGYPLISKEVAEAIYYARRIRKPDEHTNRREALSGNLAGRSQNGFKTGVAIDVGGEKSQFNKEKYLPLARDVPVPISHLCCSKTKKSPIKAYQRKNGLVPIIGTLAEESRIRTQAYVKA